MQTGKRFACIAMVTGGLSLLGFPEPAGAGHPFGTEDAGTQGKGNVEVEFNGERVRGNDGSRTVTLGNSVTMGIARKVDLALSYAYDFEKTADGTKDRAMGPVEVTLKTAWSVGCGQIPAIGLKGGISLPTEEGGPAPILATLFAEWSLPRATVFANAGADIGTRLAGNEDDSTTLRGSVAGIWEVPREWSLLSEVLWEKRASPSGPSSAEWLIGAKKVISETLAASAGIRWGLTGDSPHVTYLLGLTLGFRGHEPAPRAPAGDPEGR